MFTFKHKTDDELEQDRIEREKIYVPGQYWFTVKTFTPKNSKAGNPMLEIGCLVDFNGYKLMLKDYLLPDKIWKISTFCKSIDKEGLYKRDCLKGHEVLESVGFCEVTYELNKESNKNFLKIKKYLVPKNCDEKSPSPEEFPFDDELTF